MARNSKKLQVCKKNGEICNLKRYSLPNDFFLTTYLQTGQAQPTLAVAEREHFLYAHAHRGRIRMHYIGIPYGCLYVPYLFSFGVLR